MEAMPIQLSVPYVEEDDERLAQLTARYLESHGLHVIVAHDGAAGIRETLRLRPDVTLLDLMLPSLDRLEVCRQLRNKIDTPIIMVTARGEESDPPPEAFSACQGKSANAACTVPLPDRAVAGTCNADPRNNLFCRPAQPPPPPTDEGRGQ